MICLVCGWILSDAQDPRYELQQGHRKTALQNTDRLRNQIAAIQALRALAKAENQTALVASPHYLVVVAGFLATDVLSGSDVDALAIVVVLRAMVTPAALPPSAHRKTGAFPPAHEHPNIKADLALLPSCCAVDPFYELKSFARSEIAKNGPQRPEVGFLVISQQCAKVCALITFECPTLPSCSVVNPDALRKRVIGSQGSLVREDPAVLDCCFAGMLLFDCCTLTMRHTRDRMSQNRPLMSRGRVCNLDFLELEGRWSVISTVTRLFVRLTQHR